MPMQNAPVYAAIDIGSNTIRVVVARCRPMGLDILATDEAMVRISESVNVDGKISPEKRDETIAILHKFKSLAEEYNAHLVLAVATEAIRRAANKDEFLASIRDQTGLAVHIIAGDVEAMLTFYGATSELARERGLPARIAVMDLGGGSMELILAKNLRVTWHTSLAIGSGWIHDRYLLSDPPTAEAVATAQSFLQTYFDGLRIKRFPPLLIATGGSANSLLLLAQRAFRLSTERKVLTRDDLIRCEGLLYALPTEDIAQRYHLDPKRVRILRAGVLIICALLERFKLNELRISPQGIREGILLAYARSGERWLQTAQQSTTDVTVAHDRRAIIEPISGDMPETFAQAGRCIIWECAQKMQNWQQEVLKNEDIEAVHKMRVASRRLRAALDAYQSICCPKAFKTVYRSVKQTADVLGEARDIDVMIANVQARLAHMSEEEAQTGIAWLVDRLSNYRRQRQKKLESHLQKFDEDVFKQQLADCFAEKRKGRMKAKAKPIPQLDVGASNHKHAYTIIKARLDEMYSWDACVDNPNRMEDLHNLRIAAKRLRYTLEMFETILPEQNTSLREEVEQIQQELGTLHDSDVMTALLHISLGSQDSESSDEDAQLTTLQRSLSEKIAFSPALLSCILDSALAPSAQERQGLNLVLTYLHREREEHYKAFRNHWYRLKEQDFRRQVLDMLDSNRNYRNGLR